MPAVDPNALSNLVNIGAAGAVIAVVVLFLRFIEKRDRETRDFFTVIRASDSETSKKLADAIDKLVDRIESLENKFDAHDVKEMEFIRGVVAMQESKTQPRRA
jgi:uncharacterized iron-regulated protein